MKKLYFPNAITFSSENSALMRNCITNCNIYQEIGMANIYDYESMPNEAYVRDTVRPLFMCMN